MKLNISLPKPNHVSIHDTTGMRATQTDLINVTCSTGFHSSTPHSSVVGGIIPDVSVYSKQS